MQQDKYNSVAKFFHWSVALLIVLNYILGLTLDRTSWYTIHEQIGLTILVLVILRIVWRLISAYPHQLTSLSLWERYSSIAMHMLLYILLLSIPICGVLLVQAHGYDLSLWGFISIPKLISIKQDGIGHLLGECHELAAHTIIVLATLHALMALKHHFINKDRVLLRMLPFMRRK
jgi:cytochrome b561